MSNRKILVVTHPLGPASESHVEALLDILTELGVVTLLTANLSKNSSIRSNYKVIEISRKDTGDSIVEAGFRFVGNQWRMAKKIRQIEPDIVLFFGATSYLFPIIYAKSLGSTVILEPRGDVPLSLELQWRRRIPVFLAKGLADIVRGLEAVSYSVASGIITYTPGMAEELGLTKYDSKLYPSGARYINSNHFVPKTQFQNRERTVGYVGRLDEEKGVDNLVRVAKELSKNTTLRFVGDGALREELENDLAEEINEGNVEFRGWVEHEEIPHEISELQLLVVPSEPTEGLPTVILESFACGTPVYATPVSGTKDIVEEGKTGFRMDERDPAVIANRIEAILERDDLWEISHHCRELIEDEFSFQAAVNRYEKILDDI